jgi:hypothetical protein
VIKLQLLLGVVWFAIWVFTLIDVLSAPEPAIRRLPKLGWLLVVFVFGVIGTLAWFVLGRPERSGPRTLGAHERSTPAFPEYDRPGGPRRPTRRRTRSSSARCASARRSSASATSGPRRKPPEPTPEA